MRAAVCHQFGEPLIVEEIDVRRLSAGEVTVQVAACGICHSDISLVDGLWGGMLRAVYGHEVAGVVTEVGADALSTARRGEGLRSVMVF